MLTTPSIIEAPNDIDGLFSFRIRGEVSGEDMEAMASRMLDCFDRWEKVDMLLVFDKYDGAEAGASLGLESIKARFKSLTNVRNYVVAGAPDAAGTMVEAWSKIMPVEGRAFDTEAEAMAFLRAQPPLTRSSP